MTPTERLYEVALALASKRPSEPTSKTTLTRNAAGHVQIGLEVSAAEAKASVDTATKLFDLLCAKYPRENGEKS